ncbi:MAG: hypothetical protein CMK07_08030 [Ponticaulis sp.]|nr:hypothetical protein [Ponticaulis sp.]
MIDLKKLLRLSKGEDVQNLLLVVEQNYRLSRAKLLPKLQKFAGKIPFADDLAASWYCANDPDTPLRVKGVLFAALAYFVLPSDLVPDFIAVLGFSDDATVLATALGVVGSHIQPRHRRAARRFLKIPEPVIDQDAASAL